ncbi:hypothetical protein scyTo_0014146 [Scyliorhinus torazame]|uniref:Uncharacterized protein n=1 Tax=Scyliorhinus torazame TaxID=75743 RepID=A0A401NHH6_SCYTO|nr:hypothetical protein [Scyliorhinus torazame]
MEIVCKTSIDHRDAVKNISIPCILKYLLKLDWIGFVYCHVYRGTVKSIFLRAAQQIIKVVGAYKTTSIYSIYNQETLGLSLLHVLDAIT